MKVNNESSIQKIREFIRLPVQQAAMQQKIELENWQKALAEKNGKVKEQENEMECGRK
ncbi:MAG: hypothetical protein Q4D60_11335 [Eubacteriales bacterium]|nr:hypothetical protein [Eubacteriales bacterium]